MIAKSRSYTPGFRIGLHKIAIYGSYHWALGHAAWDRFIHELYHPIPVYETIIDYDNGSHLDTTFTYELTTAWIRCDKDGEIIEIAGLYRDGKRSTQ